jgi:hypothetical protein
MPKILLLTNSYEFNSFVEERRAIKLIINNKVEAVSYWEDGDLEWITGECKFPSILKLINPIKKFNYNSVYNFNRKAIIKRDGSACQYCSKRLSNREITIDHVVPRSHGGINSFVNCVVSCSRCNGLKRNRTPEEAGLKLISKPQIPTFTIYHQSDDNCWHKDWSYYLGNLT